MCNDFWRTGQTGGTLDLNDCVQRHLPSSSAFDLVHTFNRNLTVSYGWYFSADHIFNFRDLGYGFCALPPPSPLSTPPSQGKSSSHLLNTSHRPPHRNLAHFFPHQILFAPRFRERPLDKNGREKNAVYVMNSALEIPADTPCGKDIYRHRFSLSSRSCPEAVLET